MSQYLSKGEGTYLSLLGLHGLLHRLNLLLGRLISLLDWRLLHLRHLLGHRLHGHLLRGLLVSLSLRLRLCLRGLSLSHWGILLLIIVTWSLVLLAVVWLGVLRGGGGLLGTLWRGKGLLDGLLLHEVFLLGDIIRLSWPRFLVLLDHSLLNFKL